MKTLRLIGLLLILFGIVLLKAQNPTTIAFDYPDSDIPLITEFQVKLDGGAYASIGIPTPMVVAGTLANHKSFLHNLPALSHGNHTVAVRACNATECSWDASIVFKLIGPPSNLRIHKGE